MDRSFLRAIGKMFVESPSDGREFLADLGRVSFGRETAATMRRDWRATVEVWQSDELLKSLTEPFDADDYLEVSRPGDADCLNDYAASNCGN